MTKLCFLTISTLLATTACGDSDADLFALDDEAATQEGKADGVSGIVRLERATPDEVASAFAETRGAQLAECFAKFQSLYPTENATALTKAIADRFIDVAIRTHDGACDSWATLHDIVDGVLDATGQTEAEPAALIAEIPAWAQPQLVDASPDGYVRIGHAPLIFYYDLDRLHDANARAREQDPSGVSLADLRGSWDELRRDTNLDSTYFNPVTFPDGVLDGNQLFRYLRAAFPLRGLSLVSAGYAAVRDFGEAPEGPEGHGIWEDEIAPKLRKRSFKKRFYFSGGGNEWSSNVLIVVDEHGQAYGLQMGYSE